MQIYCHRGYHVGGAPENSLEAFEQAYSLGVDGIETDVQMSADGLPVLFHDRVVNDKYEVSSLSRDNLSELVGYHVPTLEEALTECSNHAWNLEIKTPSALHATVNLVRQCLGSRTFLITSFWHSVIAECSRLVEVECGVLIAHRPLDFSARPAWMPSAQRVDTIVWNYGTTDASILKKASQCNLRNFIYGAKTLEDHIIVLEWNPTGVITDNPEYLLKN